MNGSPLDLLDVASLLPFRDSIVMPDPGSMISRAGLIRHPGFRACPDASQGHWIPAYAGMTT